MAAAKDNPTRSRGCGGRSSKDRSEVRLLEGDCLEVLGKLEPDSVDAIVTDPPYGIEFNSEKWDGAALREVAARSRGTRLSPNGAFQEWARLWASECHRVLKPGAFLLTFGSPRTAHRLACGIEDAGLEIRDTLAWLYGSGMSKSRYYANGTATTLKPAFEPIVVARRRTAGTVEENLRRFGTGTLQVQECRVNGRVPANVVLGHMDSCTPSRCAEGCAVAEADESAVTNRDGRGVLPSRIFYCPKPSRRERAAGCEHLDMRTLDLFPNVGKAGPSRNPHPTVKPLELMRWLVRLACPPSGTVLDPTVGSGTTGAAAVLEGRGFIGIELEPAYLEIAAARISHHCPKGARKPKVRRPPLGRRR
ncbi:MAG TPA: site-specific DNA-methyltransferase [Solirubrobacterales bacterium]|nr:site-specific DNA-methyltransferase [Solirubrobacterales bacterium]